MAIAYDRKGVRERLDGEIGKKRPIVAAGAGIGLSAKFAESGGADLIIIYNSGLYRMDGLPSIAGYMPFGDANATVLEMGLRHVLPVVREAPVIAGICAYDLTRDMEVFLRELLRAGFSGVINFPTVGRIDGDFRQSMEDLGMSFRREAEVMALAGALGLFTMAYVFNPGEAEMMAGKGIDSVVAHMKTTTGGTVGSKRPMSLEEAGERCSAIFRAALAVKKDVICLAHGGPIEGPEATEYIYTHTEAAGFVGASSIERIPVEEAIRKTTEMFKSQKIKR
ncbi:MAG TPA: phosphoenolpyruvate hydrolase family protein [Thermodesulfobacteriota bacterium]|nr:phosphoenolpyruvate hydrolase family protein [Thermodesulfobacteriota bacterium]